MSVRGYVVTESDIKIIDGKEYRHEEEEYLFNLWSQSDVWDILWARAIDCTNDDCIGFIEITKDEWEDLKEDYKYHNNSEYGKKVYKVVNENKDVFEKLDSLFKNGRDYIKINCY